MPPKTLPSDCNLSVEGSSLLTSLFHSLLLSFPRPKYVSERGGLPRRQRRDCFQLLVHVGEVRLVRSLVNLGAMLAVLILFCFCRATSG